jgi:hypothetical protein
MKTDVTVPFESNKQKNFEEKTLKTTVYYKKTVRDNHD